MRKNGCAASGRQAGVFAALVLARRTRPSASAQTADEYYQEIRVGDRIYVFSTEKKVHATYQQSKDMGVSITRLGYGPNGETVTFEDAKAIELFNAKYGKTEAPPEEIKTTDIKLPFGVQYRMPGLRLSFPKARDQPVATASRSATRTRPSTTSATRRRPSRRASRTRVPFGSAA